MKLKRSIGITVMALALVVGGSAARMWAQSKSSPGDKPPSKLGIIHDKVKADKKLIVSQYMALTESEAKKFWPVYDEYQKDLQSSNERLRNLLQSYAADYTNKSMTDEKAKK